MLFASENLHKTSTHQTATIRGLKTVHTYKMFKINVTQKTKAKLTKSNKEILGYFDALKLE